MRSIKCFVFFLFLIFSCRENNYKREEQIDNKFNVFKSQKTFDNIQMSAYVLPKENIIENLDSRNNELDSELILGFEINSADGDVFDISNTNKNFDETFKYVSFKIFKDFKLLTNKGDTIQCIGAHFERTYDVAPYKRLLLYFSDINQNEEQYLIYNDKLFNKGIVKFNLKSSPIKL